MRFPLWQYLDQPLWDSDRPPIFNPVKYWQRYRRGYLNRCLDNTFLERCWNTSYQQFVVHYHDFCSRVPQEENPRWLAERCWQIERRYRAYQHPENQVSETEY